jgi:cytochrome b6-f complex iron-sulfur subunit
MKRRDLIQKIILGGATVIIVPSVISSCSKDEDDTGGGGGGGTAPKQLTIDLTSPTYSALNTAGGSVIVQNIIVANTGNDVFVALSSVCTHDGCAVGYNLAANNFPCPCHQSVFAANGSVVTGPAATSLKSYAINKSGNTLTINL